MIHTDMKITIIVMEESPTNDSLAEFFTDLTFDPFVGADRIMHRDVVYTWVRVEGQEITKYYVVASKQ
jgi:hypothetical protein